MPSDPRSLPPLADQLRAEARRLRAEADKTRAVLLAKADEMDHAAAVLDGQAGEGLTIEGQRAIDSHEMQAAEYQRHAKVTGRPPVSEHPFVVALRSRKPSMTVAQWARAHGIGRPKVMSWLSDEPKNARRIPRAMAEEIRREFKVPLGAWTNGIRED